MPSQHGGVIGKTSDTTARPAQDRPPTRRDSASLYDSYDIIHRRSRHSGLFHENGHHMDADKAEPGDNDDDERLRDALRTPNTFSNDSAAVDSRLFKSSSCPEPLLTSESMRVMILTESFHPYTSGIARRFKEIIQRLAKRGFLIHVVTGCKGCETWANELNLGGNVTFSSLMAIEFKDKIDCALPFLLPQYGILRDILKFKPNVIHCVEHTPASTFCGALCKALEIPLVWSSHTNLDFYIPLYIHPAIAPLSLRVYQLLRRTFLNMADYNLSVSSDFVKLLSTNGITKTVHVWKTGVDSESFHPKYRSHEMRLKMFNGHYSPDKILLVSVGRISPEKNFDFLLKILEKCPNTFLCIVGGGPYKESLEPLFPPEQTHFMGFLQGEELASAYASADYFVYASVSETFGQVYLEAMSSGTPIVAAEGKQMKEFFINGIHGYTWKPHDVDSAVKALNEAMKQRNILSQNCRSHALNHSWNSAANQIADIYSRFKTTPVRRAEPSPATTRLGNALRKITRGVYYLFNWLYIMILVLLFMAPFMKVAKPTKQDSAAAAESGASDEAVTQQLQQNKTTKTMAKARKNKRKKSHEQHVESIGMSSDNAKPGELNGFAIGERGIESMDTDNLSSISSTSTNASANTSASSGGSKSSSKRRKKLRSKATALLDDSSKHDEVFGSGGSFDNSTAKILNVKNSSRLSSSSSNSDDSNSSKTRKTIVDRRASAKQPRRKTPPSGLVAFILRTVGFLVEILSYGKSLLLLDWWRPTASSAAAKKTRSQRKSLTAKSRANRRRNSSSSTTLASSNLNESPDKAYLRARFLNLPAQSSSPSEQQQQQTVRSGSSYICELVQKSTSYLSTLGALLISVLSLTALFIFMNTWAFFPPAVAAKSDFLL